MVGPYTAHLHLGDASGVDGEGLQVGDGEINFNEQALNLRGKYTLKNTTNDVRCMIKEVEFKMNISTLERDYEDKLINMNDIGRVKLRTTKPLFYDSYRRNRNTGSFILINEATNETVAAGMIL